MEFLIEHAKEQLREHYAEIDRANKQSLTRFRSREAREHMAIMNRIHYLESVVLIGYICIQNKLPAGDPPFMSKMIAGYL
jgi:hypothetical protein